MRTIWERYLVGTRSNRFRGGRDVVGVVTLLSASALFVVLTYAPSPARSRGVTPNTAPSAAPPPTAAPQAVSNEGEIKITAFTHASFQLEHGDKVIHVDPTGQVSAKQADIILITDIHSDHLDPAAINRLRKEGTPVVGPAAVGQTFSGTTVITNGQSMAIAGVTIEAVPMYNLNRGPRRGVRYHPKGRGNGYVLTLGARRVYVAGDTECTPEMKALKNIDIAFVPMNLPYTMTPAEAAGCVKAFKPKVVYPYHYRDKPGVFQNRQAFTTALAGVPVEVRLLDWYLTPLTGGTNR